MAMNTVMDVILNRRSVRSYEAKEIDKNTKKEIIKAALRAPTAWWGMMLYSIIEVSDQSIKDTLAKSCDNQPFIAKAPWILLFLADWQRWYDNFNAFGIKEGCEREKIPMRKPQEGDLLIACCDALISAQTAVIAAESMGIGSCYIGDIMDNYEIHRKLFNLPPYVFPICLLCFGYPTKEQRERKLTPRFNQKFIVFENQYRRFDREAFEDMYRSLHEQTFMGIGTADGATNFVELNYRNKFNADFAKETNRSVRAMLKVWNE
jgi:FMN reductase (NADPH)/FMN reductase [NAD(P)H]